MRYFKGLHPGVALARILRDQKLTQRELAFMIREVPQTISRIITGKRSINLELGLKLELALGREEGYFMILQLYHDIPRVRVKLRNDTPDLSVFRKIVFSDIDIRSLDWIRNSEFLIQRILERGSPKEIIEIERFYGSEEVQKIRKKLADSNLKREKLIVRHGYVHKKSPL